MKPVILLIDDERDLIEVLRDTLALALPDYEAIVTTSLQDAEAALAELTAPPSLICVDHKLGGRTGLDFLEEITPQLPGVPKILFTGQAPPHVEARARSLGAKVLWKPFGMSTWIEEVQSTLRIPAA